MKLGGCGYLCKGQMLLVLKAVYPGPLYLQISNKKADLVDIWHVFNLCPDAEDQVPKSV